MCFPAQVLRETPQKWLWLQKHQSGCSVASLCVWRTCKRKRFKWLVAMYVCVGRLGRCGHNMMLEWCLHERTKPQTNVAINTKTFFTISSMCLFLIRPSSLLYLQEQTHTNTLSLSLALSFSALKVEVTTLRVCNCLIAWELPCLPQRPLLAEDRSNTLAAGDNFEDTHRQRG